jgi:ATP-dependent helicase/DNAse subunit B
MPEEIKKKKIVSFSQFTNWFTCSHKWYRDYILKEKEFEDSLHMSFGTAIHEAIQNYLKVHFHESEEKAKEIDNVAFFTVAFNNEVTKKKIPHTLPELNEFIGDGENILKEFLDPVNLAMNFSREKWELLAIEDELNVEIKNNVMLTGKLDIVLREKATGNIRIVDFKTSGSGWTSYQKEDFTKTSQLVLYKALYSKKNNIPLPKIYVEFIILKRKLYENSKYVQSRLQIFKPSSYQSDVLQVIQEFGKFVDSCFTPEGLHKTNIVYPKIPGKGKKNCKYCPYLKNKKCDGIADVVTF